MRVAITTGEDAAARVAEIVAREGMIPVVLPCIEVVPAPSSTLDEIRRAAAAADLLVFTSARPVHLLWPRGDMPAVPAACVGSATARAVLSAGGTVAYEGVGGARELICGLRLDSLYVVFPHAAGTDPDLITRMDGSSGRLLAAPVYRVVPKAPPPDPVDAVLFGSPSAVEGWHLSRDLEGLEVVAIGATTAAAVERHGRRPDVVPERPDFRLAAKALRARSTT